jgi:membrane protein YqaA with SNARE-associated domain
MLSDATLCGLFASASVLATLFPSGSKVVRYRAVGRPHYDPWLLLGVATLGNTLGALTTWRLGRPMTRLWPRDQPRRPARQRAVARVRRFGSPVLLWWLAIVRDPLCFAAGRPRLSLLLSLLFIAHGKAARCALILPAV